MVLALYSFGMVMTKTCGQTQIATFLGLMLGMKVGTVRQRLREWTYEADAKRGHHRQAVAVEPCFAPLLSWVLRLWTGRQLVLALDVTYLGARLMVLAVSVVYDGCALPVAWYVLPGHAQREWHPLWVRLLNALRPVLPSDLDVYVLTDRGLCSKCLFQVIEQKGWHPIMRIRTQGKYRRPRAKTWQNLTRLVRPGGGVWCHPAFVFKGDPIDCTLLVYWDARYDEPCLFITDLAPKKVSHHLYALRGWIECGFKDVKRGGLHWEHTKMTDPRRVERLWLVITVALLWLITVGDTHTLTDWVTVSQLAPAKLSRVTLGFLITLVAMLQHRPVPRHDSRPYEQGIFVHQLNTYP